MQYRATSAYCGVIVVVVPSASSVLVLVVENNEDDEARHGVVDEVERIGAKACANFPAGGRVVVVVVASAAAKATVRVEVEKCMVRLLVLLQLLFWTTLLLTKVAKNLVQYVLFVVFVVDLVVVVVVVCALISLLRANIIELELYLWQQVYIPGHDDDDERRTKVLL